MADWTGWMRERLKGLDVEPANETVFERAGRLIAARVTLGEIDDTLSGRTAAPIFGAFVQGDAVLELRRTVGPELEARLRRLDAELTSILLRLAGAATPAPAASVPPAPAAAPEAPTKSLWQRLFGRAPKSAPPPAPEPTPRVDAKVPADVVTAGELSARLPVELWLALLTDHPGLRDVLSRRPPPRAREAIEGALARRNGDLTLPLLRALAALADPQAEAAIRAVLWATRDVETRWAAITALVRSDRRRAAEFATGPVEERVAVVEGLAGLVEVCAWLSDGSPLVLQEVRRQIAALEPRLAVAGLARALRDGPDEVRLQALNLLGPLVDEHAASLVEPLIPLVVEGGALLGPADAVLARCVAVPSLGRANLQALKRARLPEHSASRAALAARTQQQSGASPVAGLPELEGTLEERDAGDPAWLIYADALTASGDLRGEAITRASQGHPPRAFLESHAEVLLGRLPAIVGEKDLGAVLDGLRYRAGLIDGAALRLDYELAQRVNMEDVVDAFLEAPAARFVRALEIGLVTFNSEENDYEGVVDVLGRARHRHLLRSLVLGEFDYPGELQISWTPWGDLSRLWSALPALTSFHVRGAGGSLGAIVAPRLERLTIETGGLSRATLDAVIAMNAPKLSHLEVWFGDEYYGAECELADAERLLDALPPTVTSLGLCNAAFTHELVPVLAISKALPRLTRLDLSRGVLNDADVPALVARARAFAHLSELNLDQNQLDEGGEALVAALPMARVADQRVGDVGDRYVAVGE